ncbi:hypothetical protein V6N12_062599 [Hibiscus sabdariffa]|uniref:DUF4283 domain-containing protein n=1 Tax=Hibiscus sabdariffa TaxID=183260 RepID=A0ABR2F9B8_9ROSI
MVILKNCAMGFCRRPFWIAELVDNILKAGLQGFSVMRVTGSSLILMFDNDGNSAKSFGNIVNLWGEITSVYNEILAHSPCEQARFQIEIDWCYRIDEELDLRVGDQCFTIRVTDIEEAIGPKCDCCCELLEGSHSTSEQEGEMDVFEQSNGSEVKCAVHETCLEGTVVPNSLISKSMNSMEMVRMWKGVEIYPNKGE